MLCGLDKYAWFTCKCGVYVGFTQEAEGFHRKLQLLLGFIALAGILDRAPYLIIRPPIKIIGIHKISIFDFHAIQFNWTNPKLNKKPT